MIGSHFGLFGTGGMVGVTLFFVLSGFLITHLLLDENATTGRIDILRFYGRRALRLLPALAIYLIGVAGLIWLLRLEVPIWDITWPPALYVANYWQLFGHDLYAHRHTWSLAVEEHFYLVWPLLVVLGATRHRKALAVAVASLLAWRIGVGFWNPSWAYLASDTNAYAMGLGCLLATYRHDGSLAKLGGGWAKAGVVALVLLSLGWSDGFDQLYEIGVWLPPLAAGVAALTIWSAADSTPTGLTDPVLRWLGRISYALYLWHAPLFQLPAFAGPVARLAALALAIGIASLSWALVEGPILRSRMRQHLVPDTRALESIPGRPA